MKQQFNTVLKDFIKLYIPVMAVIIVVSFALYHFDNQQQEKWITYIVGDVCLFLLIGLVVWRYAKANYKLVMAETDLKKEKEKFQLVADYTCDWVFWSAPDGRYIYISPACERISGYPVEDFMENPNLLITLIHPDDLAPVKEDDGFRSDAETLCNITFRIINTAGEVKWIEHVCQPVYSEDGEFLGRRGHNSDITSRKEAELALQEFSTHDDLTGLPNRTLLYDRLTLLIAHAARGNNIFGVMFIDLEALKEINDALGHEAGDLVLQQIAERMQSVLRKSDTVARIGGDEFIVVLPDIAEMTTANDIAQKLIDIINLPVLITIGGREVEQSVGASIGISIYPADGQTIDNLINSADQSMYEAKKIGKNHFCRVSKISN